MAGETATVTPATTPAPAMMLSGGMQGSLPPEVTNAPLANVQPAGATYTPGASYTPGEQQPDMQQQAPSGVSDHPEMQAAAVHHGRIGRALDAVSKALGGSQTMHVVEMPDGSFVAKEMDSTPGERWSRIAKAALSGAAAGFAHGQGRGGGAKAFAAGAQTGLSLPQVEQDQTTKKAEDLEAQREKQTLFNKNMAMMDVELTKNNLAAMQMKQRFPAEMQEHADNRLKFIESQKGMYLAHYTNSKDLNDHLQTNQEMLDKMVGTGGHLDQVPEYDSNGTVTGYKVYGIPRDTLNQYNTQEVKIPHERLSPDLQSIETTYETIKPGQDLGSNILAAQKKADIDNGAARMNLAKLQDQRIQTAAEKAKADAEVELTPAKKAALYAQAAEANAKAANAKDGGSWKPYPGTSPEGEPLFRNDQGDIQSASQIASAAGRSYTGPKKILTAQDRGNYQQKYVLPMNTADAFYNVLQQGYNNVRAGKGSGEAELSAMQTNALNALNLTGAGSRASGAQMIDRELDARGLVDKKTGFFTKLASGKSLSQNDWKNILDNAETYRNAAITKTAEGAKGYGMAASSLLREQGRDTKANRAVAQGYGIPSGYQQVITDADGKVLGFGKKDKDGTPTLYYDVYGEKM